MGVLLAALAFLLASCGAGGPLEPVASLLAGADEPLVAVTSSGGHCLEGTCESTVMITGAGRVRRDDGPSVALGASRLLDLVDAIRAADFVALRSRPFTGQCPTAWDGQELTYTFATPAGPVSLASCAVDIDPSHPLFAAVDAAVALAP